jgi:hypothetical protein
MSTSSTPTRGKLTSHQREVYNLIVRLSRRRAGDRWVSEAYIGSHGACCKLVEKGWIEVQSDTGPRGGTHREYRPVAS